MKLLPNKNKYKSKYDDATTTTLITDADKPKRKEVWSFCSTDRKIPSYLENKRRLISS